MNLKFLLSLLLAGLLVVFVIQNAGAVELHFLFWRFALSQALLVFFVFAAGLLAGWLLHGLAAHRRRAAAAAASSGGRETGGG